MFEKPYHTPKNGKHSSNGQLILVATPIGNLADISTRALETLQQSDAILCEDTRVTTKLLRHYSITNTLIPVHDHNEQDKIPALIARLHNGETLALVSDAGTPIVSDPGYRLVREVLKENISLTSLPGANAVITALTLSGLPPAPFMFLGFPARGEARKQHFSSLRAAEQAGLSATLIWYESPHRLQDTLRSLIEIFGQERHAAVGRELSKRFEEMVRGSLMDIEEHFKKNAPRGEITLLVGPPPSHDTGAQELDQILSEALRTHSVKDAATLVAGMVNLPKRTIYSRALELSRSK